MGLMESGEAMVFSTDPKPLRGITSLRAGAERLRRRKKKTSMAAAIRAPAIADPIPTPAAAPGLMEFELFRRTVLLDDPMDGFGDVEMLVLPEVGLDVVMVFFAELAMGPRLCDGLLPAVDGVVDKGGVPDPTPDGNAFSGGDEVVDAAVVPPTPGGNVTTCRSDPSLTVIDCHEPSRENCVS